MKHGHASNYKGKKVSPTYKSWVAMVQRCTKEYHPHYNRYKGMLSDRWKDFKLFLEDMGERPESLTLDRIDPTKGYYKENCRWADRKTQQRNRNSNSINLDIANKIINLRERGLKLREISEELSINESVVKNVIYRGDWS